MPTLSTFLRWLALLGACGCAGQLQAAEEAKLPPPASGKIDFARDIQPIFERACLRCHGPERPRSHFRLDTREHALKGGDDGVDIVPGESAKSALIRYVAGLEQDKAMPPQGKGDPLTPAEIGLLRAWIDQGVDWSGAPAIPKTQFTFTTGVRYLSVSGDAAKFRENAKLKDGATGGLEHFRLDEQVGPDERFTAEGRIIGNDDDYRLNLSLEKNEFGFARAGFEQYRTYYDNSGGYHPELAGSPFALGRGLSLDNGKAWIEFDLAKPDVPHFTIGYEYHYREGAESTLQWGNVIPASGDNKNVYPSFKEINEKLHVFRLDASHEIAGFQIEDNFRAELYRLSTRSQDVDTFIVGKSGPDKLVITDEGSRYFQGVNTITFQKPVKDWWLISGGYLYSRTTSDASFNQNTLLTPNASLVPVTSGFGQFWNANSITLDQESHVFNFNSQFTPLEGLTVAGGVQNELQRQSGFGNVNLDLGDPTVSLFFPLPATISANEDRKTREETATLHYTKIPFTVLYADARFHQESIGQFDQDVGGGQDFLQNTDAGNDVKDIRAGFSISPWQRVTFNAEYRHDHDHTSYTHRVDEAFGFPNNGYSAFITSRDIDTDEVKARLALRWTKWLKTTLTYQVVASDFANSTDAEPFTGSPGGAVLAGNLDTHIYSANVELTPWQRLYFSSTLSYYQSSAISATSGNVSVVPYAGDIYTVLSSVTYVLDKRTDLNASYAYSRSAYGQNNVANGLPLGVDYEWHNLQTGITRRIKENVKLSLQYLFSRYREPTSAGANDYTAHGVFATLTVRWP